MNLFLRRYPSDGPPLVVLHGLLGSSRNWHVVGRELSKSFSVSIPDLRNHGESPHDPVHDIPSMARDVVEFLDAEGLDRIALVGHSMGGKVAMRLACDVPERLDRIAVVDIAPRDYGAGTGEIAAMLAVDLDRVGSRRDADEQLSRTIDDEAMRLFLLSNLVREGDQYRWRPGLRAIEGGLSEIRGSPLAPDEQSDVEVLFVRGALSGFMVDSDAELISRHFRKARIETLEGSGHNPHFDERAKFVALVRAFLSGETA
ncbi:MAG: alpha/beta fold hydrolase [Planctomycetota bacterium]